MVFGFGVSREAALGESFTKFFWLRGLQGGRPRIPGVPLRVPTGFCREHPFPPRLFFGASGGWAWFGILGWTLLLLGLGRRWVGPVAMARLLPQNLLGTLKRFFFFETSTRELLVTNYFWTWAVAMALLLPQNVLDVLTFFLKK